jgi:hypothetical protein
MMLQLFRKESPWFRARRYGYGAGPPIKWQGWALLAAYLTGLAVVGILSHKDAALPRTSACVLFVIITIIFTAICRDRTDGGWRWRWGE